MRAALIIFTSAAFASFFVGLVIMRVIL